MKLASYKGMDSDTYCSSCDLHRVLDEDNVLTCEGCGSISEARTENVSYDNYRKTTIATYKSEMPIKGRNPQVVRKLASKAFAIQIDVPKEVRNDWMDMIADFVSARKIIRGNIRLGTLAALLYTACMINGYTKKPKELIEAFGIDQDKFSEGDKKITAMLNNAEYTFGSRIQEKINRHSQRSGDELAREMFVRAFIRLDMDTKYLEFCIRLYTFCAKYGICRTSVPSSACAGIMYLILRISGSTVNQDIISSACGKISKSTFTRYEKGIQDVYKGIETGVPREELPLFRLMRARMLRIFADHNVKYYA